MKNLIYILTLFFIVSCNNYNSRKKLKKEVVEENIIDRKTGEKLEFNPKIIKLENVSNDTIVYGTYNFKNTSNQLLIIKHVETDCICTSYKLSADTIQPNNEGEIVLELNTKGKYGNVKIDAVIESNATNKFNLIQLFANIRMDN
jgi:hypothetical protein